MFFIRLPITMSAPCVELGHETGDLVEVVGEVGVGHDDVPARARGEPRHIGAAVAALRLVHDDRAGVGGQARAAVLESLSATITSPVMRCSRARRAPRARNADRLLLIEARDHDRIPSARPERWAGSWARDVVAGSCSYAAGPQTQASQYCKRVPRPKVAPKRAIVAQRLGGRPGWNGLLLLRFGRMPWTLLEAPR